MRMAALKVMDDASMVQAGIVMVSDCLVSSSEAAPELLEDGGFFKSFFERKVDGVSSSQVPLTISCRDSSWSDDLRREKRREARDLRRPPNPAGRLEERDTLEDLLARKPPEVLNPAEALSPPDALKEGMADRREVCARIRG